MGATIHNRRNSGSAMIEFVLAAILVGGLFGGLFEFAHLFLEYSLLHHTVRQAVEYASTSPYDSSNPTASSQFRAAIENIVLYGEPAPKQDSRPVVPDLTREQISLDVKFENRVPVAVTVGVRDFAVRGLFKTYTFSGKPRLTFPYLGRLSAL